MTNLQTKIAKLEFQINAMIVTNEDIKHPYKLDWLKTKLEFYKFLIDLWS